ncbi:hypothetical protein V5N11_027429 [Cardamine amara subsp. amara]|uniref:Uncharacterized protein n=1 Tax=Cardamine amara subsp. amara TaxID=228776 RepID=A0ABD1C635_CARAN
MVDKGTISQVGVAVIPVVGEPIMVVPSLVEAGIREEEKEIELSGNRDLETVSVVVEAAKEIEESLINLEHEKGEIEDISGDECALELPSEEGWEVTTSGGRKSSRKKALLEYGHVRILSPSRFEILRNQNEEVENKEDKPEELEVGKGSDVPVETVVEADLQLKLARDVVGSGVSLPRNSKNAHRYPSDTSKK